METEKIVVLNSGGFDSIVLINQLYLGFPNAEIHSLHFTYGARNTQQQLNCVNRVCEKLNINSMVIPLPEFTWTKGNFYKEGYTYDTQYVEYRNLVFLSYALSYAESIGATKIYLAVLKGSYKDNNGVFFNGLNSFSIKNSGIEIVTPFRDLYKEDLLSLAVSALILPTDYFSCDVPNEKGEPCGECLDCKSLKDINSTLTVDHPMKAFYRSYGDFSDKEFKRLLSEVKPTEVRALINNICQLKCKHCFYGFDEMKGDALPKEDYYRILKEFVLNYGIKNIHFSGKEPLFNDTVLYYAEQIKKDNLPCTFDLVTNGINVPKYVKRLKELGIQKLFLSVDDVLDTNGVRSVHNTTHKALRACEEADVEVEIFIDLHENNFNRLKDIIDYLEANFLIQKKYYIRTIRSIGNATNQKCLTGQEIDTVWLDLNDLSEKYINKHFTLSIGIEYVDSLDNTQLIEDIGKCESIYTTYFTENLSVLLEEYCERYGSYTLTPDGYLLGCASEVALSNYNEVSVGNVKDTPLNVLIERGKQVAYSCNDHFIGQKLCCSCNKICKTP